MTTTMVSWSTFMSMATAYTGIRPRLWLPSSTIGRGGYRRHSAFGPKLASFPDPKRRRRRTRSFLLLFFEPGNEVVVTEVEVEVEVEVQGKVVASKQYHWNRRVQEELRIQSQTIASFPSRRRTRFFLLLLLRSRNKASLIPTQ